MAYEPKEWTCGETITADALNHLEQGVANCGGGEFLAVNANAVRGDSEMVVTLDKTWQQIKDAYPQAYISTDLSALGGGQSVMAITGVGSNSAGYVVTAYPVFETLMTDSPDGYPSYSYSGTFQ